MTEETTLQNDPQPPPRPIQFYRPSNRPFNPRTLLNSLSPTTEPTTTTQDVRLAHKTLHDKTEALENAPLLTRKLRNAEQQKRMSRFPHTAIRFLFPDRYTIQSVFKPDDRIGELMKFIKGVLRGGGEGWGVSLFTTPPKKVLGEMRSTLWKEGLAPAALVHVGIEKRPADTKSLVKEEVWAVLEDAPVPKVDPGAGASLNADGEGGSQAGSAGASSKMKSAMQSGKKAAGKAMPKWLVKNLKKR